METIKLIISDETLRDGEQQVGVFFDGDTKHQLAQLIARTGVHQIALMPAVHPAEARLVTHLVAAGLTHQVIASTMLTRACIDQSKACGVGQIILFNAVSDRLLFLRDAKIAASSNHGKTVDDNVPESLIDRMRQTMMDNVLDHLQYAKAQGLNICFAAEDASRADFDFLVDCIIKFQPYVDQVLLCDTVGVLTPEKSFIWIRDLLECTHNAPLAVHFHNDMGLALENTIQAVQAGATGISGTFGGIGERAGNVALEQVLNGLRMRFGWEVEGINYDAVAHVTDFLNQRGVRSHPPYSQQSQRHETGIHVHSLLRDRQSYSIFPHSHPEIWFGKFSGAGNFQYLFEHYLQTPLTRDQYEQLRSDIKALSILKRRSFSTTDVVDMLQRGELLP
ncbi:MAG: LeuA family protein [Elainellaceae cyanobacterium]